MTDISNKDLKQSIDELSQAMVSGFNRLESKIDSVESRLESKIEANSKKLEDNSVKLENNSARLEDNSKRLISLQNTVDTFAGEIVTKRDEDLIVKQHVTENRKVITALADKAGIVTNF